MQILDISKMLTMSTGHISWSTAKRLDEECSADGSTLSMFPVVYKKGDVGWFIYVGDGEDEEVPDDLARCIKLAKLNKCDWLCLDRDADVVDTLDVYEW